MSKLIIPKTITILLPVMGIVSLHFLACAQGNHHVVPVIDNSEIMIDAKKPFRLTIEVADTPQERALGLMERKHLAPDHGMLFVFEAMGNHALWMKNTYVPLDMIFFDEEFAVVGTIENTIPLSLDIKSIDRNSRYVLEVLAGTAKKYGIELTTKAQLLYE